VNELALFAGGGGGLLASKLLGWRTVCAVEYASYPRSILLARQRDGLLDQFPVWDDVRTFDGKPWRGRVDVISGGFPCQDISIAGGAGQEGIEGDRSGLWAEFARIIGEVRPSYAFIENSPMLLVRGFERVLCDLADMGFNAQWGVLGGFSVGLCVNRKRLWIVASRPDSVRLPRPQIQIEKPSAVASSKRQFERASGATVSEEDHAAMYRNPDGLAGGVDRLKAIGNGQVPGVAAAAWRILMERIQAER